MNALDYVCLQYQLGITTWPQVISFLSSLEDYALPLSLMFRETAKEQGFDGYIYYYEDRLYALILHKSNGNIDAVHIERIGEDKTESLSIDVLLSNKDDSDISFVKPLCDKELFIFNSDLYITYRQIKAVLEYYKNKHKMF